MEQLYNKDTSLTIDFNELQRVVLACANPAGFDPIAEYLEQKKETAREKKTVWPRVDTGMLELEASKHGRVLDKQEKDDIIRTKRHKIWDRPETGKRNRFKNPEVEFQNLKKQNA